MFKAECESLPKDFEKTTEVLPFTKYGLSSIEEFKRAENELHHQEWLKKAGLTREELVLYQQDEAGLLDHRKKIESGVLKNKLDSIHNKIKSLHNSTIEEDNQPSTSSEPENLLVKLQRKPITFYPEGHPMNELKELEESLFGHLKTEILPITKRRKILRRLERKKERLLLQEKQVHVSDDVPSTSQVDRPGSLWDIKEMPSPNNLATRDNQESNRLVGPKQRTMYTIKDNKIVRLESMCEERDKYRAVDIVIPVNSVEAELLEGTKMAIDNIKKIERFKDYQPGSPSKVLYLKNIAPSVTQEQLSVLFIQFVLANGAPVDLRLLSGRMRGQAFVTFQNEEVAIQALEEINGTILSGRPIIAQFGRNTNRIQPDDHR